MNQFIDPRLEEAYSHVLEGDLKDAVDILLDVPSKNTPRIQELHILAGHIICGLVEKELLLLTRRKKLLSLLKSIFNGNQ